MAILDARTASYVIIFRSQRGGGADMPVFHGLGRYQGGKEFDDLFRGLIRRGIHIALNVG